MQKQLFWSLEQRPNEGYLLTGFFKVKQVKINSKKLYAKVVKVYHPSLLNVAIKTSKTPTFQSCFCLAVLILQNIVIDSRTL